MSELRTAFRELIGFLIYDLDITPEDREREVSRVRLAVMGILVTVQLFLLIISPGEDDVRTNLFLFAIGLVGITYSLFVIWRIRTAYRATFALITTLIDASLLTGTNIVASTYFVRHLDAVTKWTTLLTIYILIVIVAGLRLSHRVTYFAGITCIFLYLTTLLIAIVGAERSYSYNSFSEGTVNVPLGLVFAAFIGVATWCVDRLVFAARTGAVGSRRGAHRAPEGVSPNVALRPSMPVGRLARGNSGVKEGSRLSRASRLMWNDAHQVLIATISGAAGAVPAGLLARECGIK